MTEPKRPMAEANGISALLNQVFGPERFPVKVAELALEYSQQRFPRSPITKVHGATLPCLEGMLKPNKDRTRWLIVYDAAVTSPGRTQFTIAHEFGHYLLHRELPGQGNFCARPRIRRDGAAASGPWRMTRTNSPPRC